MSFRLVSLSPGLAGPVSLQRPVLLVGRHPECDLRIESAKISRRHCCLGIAYDRVLIRDLGSRNGLRVNGVLVREARLKPNDEIAIGPYLFRVELDSAEAPATPRPEPTPTAATPVPAAAIEDDEEDDLVDLIPIDDD